MNPNERARKAFENAISSIRKNAKKLQVVASEDIQIGSKKEFSEFAERLGDKELAEAFMLAKYGKHYKKRIER